MAKSIPPKDQNEPDSARETSPAKTAASQERGVQENEYTLLVQRQDAIEKPETRRIAELRVKCSATTSVLGALKLEREAGAGSSSKTGGSVAWEGDCFDGSCGGCTMLIQGKVALACTVPIAKAADKEQRVRLAPMRTFPLVRDLVVDRSRIQRNLSLVPLQGPRTPSASVKNETPSATLALELARLDQCHRCGACLEACPQYGVHSEFVGALTLHEVHLRNTAPGARHQRSERLEAMMAPGGVNSCGKAQNCVEVCPAELPLVDSIQNVARATTKHMLFGWLAK